MQSCLCAHSRSAPTIMTVVKLDCKERLESKGFLSFSNVELSSRSPQVWLYLDRKRPLEVRRNYRRRLITWDFQVLNMHYMLYRLGIRIPSRMSPEYAFCMNIGALSITPSINTPLYQSLISSIYPEHTEICSTVIDEVAISEIRDIRSAK